jgi:hypothetical protein
VPIKIPDALPARETLLKEGVAVMQESVAVRQDIRPAADRPAEPDAEQDRAPRRRLHG